MYNDVKDDSVMCEKEHDANDITNITNFKFYAMRDTFRASMKKYVSSDYVQPKVDNVTLVNNFE